MVKELLPLLNPPILEVIVLAGVFGTQWKSSAWVKTVIGDRGMEVIYWPWSVKLEENT